MNTPPLIEGSCLCGRCHYSAGGRLFDVLHCHCSNCRKVSGSAFASYGGVLKDDFIWLCELSNLTEYQTSASVMRYACQHCFSRLISIDDSEPNTIYLSLASIDSDTEIIPAYHQFVSSKADWYQISDDLPQFASQWMDSIEIIETGESDERKEVDKKLSP